MSGVGHAVLYAAFAVVALWLLGELLLQHRAEPHWRALALLGFLGLVAGVAQGSLPLIAAGVVGFGVGQFLVSRSVRTGGRTHWSLRSADGALPGPLAGLPLLGSVFPAGETPAAAHPLPGQRVGEVGPVEPVEPPVQEQQAYGYDQQAYAYAPTEYQQQPVYAEYDYSQQQQQQEQQQQPQYDYTGYDQYQYQYQQQPQYDYQQQQPQQYDYGQQPQPQYDYTGYEQPQPQQTYVYQPEPMEEPEPEPWQPYPQQYS